MRITILGSGTSTGVPEYRCTCATCEDARSPGSQNRRTRSSVHIEKNGMHLQVDTGPNFLDQIDLNRIERIDAVIYTHCHNDHIAGTNDLVMPCRKQNMDMPIYGPEETIRVLQRNFDYMFTKETFQGGGVAHLLPHIVDGPFELCGINIIPILVVHGAVQSVGFRFDNFGYLPDVKSVPEASMELLHGVDVLIIDALSFNPKHPTHLSVGEAIDIANDLGSRSTYFTHISHRLDQQTFREQCSEQGIDLPKNVDLAFDGQVIEL